MQKSRLWRGLFSFVLLTTSFSPPAIPIEGTDASEFVPLVHDQQNADTPGDFFPLLSPPTDAPVAVRTEAWTPEKDRQWKDMRSRILRDFGNRISPDFKVPAGLQERTAFWFDIYTRYGEAHHIIHHLRYPWIVFRVFDSTQTLLNGKGPAWLRRDRAQKMARAQTAEIRAALQRLARRNSYGDLPRLEQELFDKLSGLPGTRKAVIRLAARSVRSQLGQKDFFQRGLVNSSRYLPYMEAEFRQLGLPVELTRMPFVESSFNENAYSKVGASGIWQIMPRTGKAYMIVNEHVDERNSPLKATVTAGRLLRSYFKFLKSWPLTITSYNHGIGNIQKAIKRAGSRDLSEIISRYHQGDFRFASSNFFTCFLAAMYAEKYHELIFKEVPREPLQEREIIRVAAGTRTRALMKITGMNQEQLLRYNLDLRGALKFNTTLPRGFKLHVPPASKMRVSAN